MKTKTSPIALFCSSLSWGGLEMNVVRFGEEFQKLGYRVFILAVADSPIASKSLSAGLELVPIVCNKRYFDIKNAKKLSGILQEKGCQYLWVNDPRDLSTAGWAKRFVGKECQLVYNQGMQFSKAKRDLIHSLRFKAIDAWVAPLPYLKKQVEEMTRFPKERIHLIPRGVEEKRVLTEMKREAARTFFGIPHNLPLAGVIGRLDVLKGQETAIEAIAILRDKGIDHGLLIVGESTKNEGNAYELQLKAQVKEWGLEDRVTFRPYSDQVAAFYKAIDRCIVPSHAETIGMITIEAMLAGTPVYGTNTSGTPELLIGGELGQLFPPQDAQALARLLENGLKDEGGEQQKASYAKSYAQQFYTLKSVMLAYHEMLQKL